MIKLTIIVDDVDVYIGMGYTHVRVYTSTSEADTYTHLVDIVLVAGKTEYSYTHVVGTSDTWYKSSIYDSVNDEECCWSDPVKGVSPALFHYSTFPTECEFSSADDVIIRKIRRLIGDLEGLERIYITNTSDELTYLIQNDNKTVELNGDKGWPVYVSLGGVEKTTIFDPVIQGYRWASFSGTLGDSDYPIDIWYHSFGFSDREIYESYGDAQMPPMLTSSTVTQDHLILEAAIDLLESQVANNIMNDGAAVQDDNSSYDPGVGINATNDLLQRLRKQLDALVRQYQFSNISGILID